MLTTSSTPSIKLVLTVSRTYISSEQHQMVCQISRRTRPCGSIYLHKVRSFPFPVMKTISQEFFHFTLISSEVAQRPTVVEKSTRHMLSNSLWPEIQQNPHLHSKSNLFLLQILTSMWIRASNQMRFMLGSRLQQVPRGQKKMEAQSIPYLTNSEIWQQRMWVL